MIFFIRNRGELKFPTSLEDIKSVSDLLMMYKDEHFLYVLVLFCSAYIYKQTFAIPGSVFMVRTWSNNDYFNWSISVVIPVGNSKVQWKSWYIGGFRFYCKFLNYSFQYYSTYHKQFISFINKFLNVAQHCKTHFILSSSLAKGLQSTLLLNKPWQI